MLVTRSNYLVGHISGSRDLLVHPLLVSRRLSGIHLSLW